MKWFSKFCTILLVLVMAFGLTTTAFAAGTVTYKESANKFIFAPGSEESATSLFEDFQNVMPGDTLTEQIVIKNDTSNKIKLKVYLRSHGAQEGTDDFLSQMNLTVQDKNKSKLFDAPADELADLSKWTYLGTVYSGGNITLDLTLEVPVTMGDAYQNAVGYIDWEFMVEELPIEPSDPDAPKTGDTAEVFVYGGLLAVSLAAFLLLMKRRKQTEED